ncbi:DNA-3-methyladenine glycosylase I [Streptococcus sp. zg-JUN1979]|uniref:DNA-3-methyladenine glycosylase I n=1 Tax=Streptococcus sp. zg-JUN1979 TaxID=3391450 RepID=UPI0039A67DF1
MKRCSWVKLSNPLYIDYHDKEWGRPLHKEQALFELLCLETYQAGLSWETVLNKRQAFREAFYDYDPQKVAMMTDEALDKLLENPNIIRHRAKLYATRSNARAYQTLLETYDSFSSYIWEFVGFKTQVNSVEHYTDLPSKTELSERISKDMKRRGFRFVGPVCIYSFLQAAGLINDHENDCAFK